MLWHLIATVVAGFGAAGIALMIRAATRQKAPKWLVPVFAGAGMLAYQIHGEYTWFEHKQAQLPEGSVVVQKSREPAIWKPWTFIIPRVGGFTVLDTNSIRTSATQDSVVGFRLYRFEHSQTDQVANSRYLLNCESRELGQLNDEGAFHDGSLTKLPNGDPLLTEVCR
ncbi:hypothetical protein C8D92_1125 [Tamilnaduibacter salinus]|uniref:Uncharacterized protein n=1 Tax=Tamilnaduibacter salinus TaxID=1484056 RepID=A0A2U1CT50_9GAMM|nr:hypothetical protein [Tamilnaduibacter salinus]PVY69603.1 hypothetical protein C8D92_1125 [Tamilnaduibacter salinus]